MPKLTHYRLCPHSRAIRLALAETGVEVEFAEEKPWEWRPQFLALNPAGELPVLDMGAGLIVAGAYAIAEYLDEDLLRRDDPLVHQRLFPGDIEDRAEVRRLVDWFQGKLFREVTRDVLDEKLYARLNPSPDRAPAPDILRAARANMRYHMSYVGFLAHQRHWLAGDVMSFADLAAAAQLSAIDYVGEVPWDDYPAAKNWYARVKSRPSFRSILADRVPGAPPPAHYIDLDF